MIPKSGGDYAYISEAFGPLPAFLYLWVALLVLVPTGNAITALTFAQYILQPAWPTCEPPYEAVRLLAAVITCKYSAVSTAYAIWHRLNVNAAPPPPELNGTLGKVF
jgi:amino acid transporter